MTVRSQTREARKSLSRGRVDEALVYLWGALEPARLERGATLRELQRLSLLVRDRGDEGQRREAERLLEAIGRSSEEGGQVEVGVVTERRAGALEEAEPATRGDDSEEGEPVEGRSTLGRLLLPIVFLVIILINVITRIADGG